MKDGSAGASATASSVIAASATWFGQRLGNHGFLLD
jgi:hypothetical protein